MPWIGPTQVAVTPVKNHGSCGSCWYPSSTTGALEGALALSTAHFVVLRQQLVDGDIADQSCFINLWLRRENLENRTIPSDHAAVRLVIQKPTNRVQQGKRIPSWMSKHPVFCSLLQRPHDDHCFSTDPFGALTEFKVFLEKAKRLTIRELSRKTPDSSGAKLLIACTALRAYRNRHLGTLMRCCKGWKPIENCFDPISFECVDFQRLCQIIANLACENLAEREAEITNLPWTQTEKYNALA